MTRPQFVQRYVDRRYGTQIGRAIANGFSMAGADGARHVDTVVDAQAARAVETQRFAFRRPKERAAQTVQDAAAVIADAEREVERRAAEESALAAELAALEAQHGPGRIAYGAMLAVLFALTLPIDYGAAMWTPLPQFAQWLLATLIGAAMVLAAHVAAKQLEELRKAHRLRLREPFRFWQETILLATALLFPAAVIVGTAVWRGAAFAAASAATGGVVDGGAANAAFAALALLAFGTAVLAGIGFQRSASFRALRRERARVRRALRRRQRTADRAERRRRRAEVRLIFLDEREARVIEAIAQRARERKARISQRAADVELVEALRRDAPFERGARR